MPDIIESPVLSELLAVDVTKDETHVLVTGCLDNGKTFRLPMTADVAMRLLGLLKIVQEDYGFPMPPAPVLRNKMQ